MQSNAVNRVAAQVEEVKDAYEHGAQAARDLTHAALGTSKEAACYADEWVRDNTWKLLGVALAAGLVLGLLAVRPSRRTPERVPL